MLNRRRSMALIFHETVTPSLEAEAPVERGDHTELIKSVHLKSMKKSGSYVMNSSRRLEL